MTQAEKYETFKSLHKKGDPVILYNVWDAGSAKAIADAGAKAIATGSWSVAAAQGFEDGEALPLGFLVQIANRISETVDLPVSIDFEGGYAEAPEALTKNALKLIEAGAIGVNFEDRIVKGEGLYSIEKQCERIKAIKDAAGANGVSLFLNARTDLFLGSDPATHASFVAEALDRMAAYADAGADSFFIPGLTAPKEIERITAAASLPVNVMMMGNLDSIQTLSRLGVSRISFGPGPYRTAMAGLKERFKAI